MGYYVRMRRNGKKVGELGPFTTQKLAVKQAQPFADDAAKGVVVTVEPQRRRASKPKPKRGKKRRARAKTRRRNPTSQMPGTARLATTADSRWPPVVNNPAYAPGAHVRVARPGLGLIAGRLVGYDAKGRAVVDLRGSRHRAPSRITVAASALVAPRPRSQASLEMEAKAKAKAKKKNPRKKKRASRRRPAVQLKLF